MYIGLGNSVAIRLLTVNCNVIQTAFFQYNIQNLFSLYQLQVINVKSLSRLPWLDGKSGEESKQSPPTTTIKMPLTPNCTSWAAQNPIAWGRKTTDGLLFTTGSMLGSVVLMVCCKTKCVLPFFPTKLLYLTVCI